MIAIGLKTKEEDEIETGNVTATAIATEKRKEIRSSLIGIESTGTTETETATEHKRGVGQKVL